VERGEYDFRFQAQTRVGASPEEAVTLFGASVEQVDEQAWFSGHPLSRYWAAPSICERQMLLRRPPRSRSLTRPIELRIRPDDPLEALVGVVVVRAARSWYAGCVATDVLQYGPLDGHGHVAAAFQDQLVKTGTSAWPDLGSGMNGFLRRPRP